LALSSAIDCKVINNTFYNCGQATMRFLTTSYLYPELSGNRIENNIFAFGNSAYINGGPQPATAASFSNNIYMSIYNKSFIGPYWDTPELDEIKDQNPMNYGSDTKMFADASVNDFHLTEGSPAIGGAKTATEPLTDFYGKPFSNNSRSIGAIEFNAGTDVKENNLFTNNLYPNPAGEYIEITIERCTTPGRCGTSGDIQIFDMLGEQVIFVVNVHARSLQIDVLNLPPGIYFIKIGNRVEKFVKI
jgi:hypothetical protein